MSLIVKSNIKKVVRELDKDNDVSSVAEEVGMRLEIVVEEILEKAIKRAKENSRRTLQARDLWKMKLSEEHKKNILRVGIVIGILAIFWGIGAIIIEIIKVLKWDSQNLYHSFN